MVKIKLNKKAVAMSFNWIFAIIAGAVILLLAVYGASRIIDTGKDVIHTESAARLIALLDSAEAGIASGSSDMIEFKVDTRTQYTCSDEGVFWKQTVAFSQETFGKLDEPKNAVPVVNKYVFSENNLNGNIYIFSKPFFMPFKVADLIFISSEDYCFAGAPRDIEKNVEGLGNVEAIDLLDENDCEGIKVCFLGRTSYPFDSCDINVRALDNNLFEKGYIEKGSDQVYYVDSLLYGAIFSSPEIYECNVKRLMKKLNVLAEVYLQKISVIHCGETMRGNLIDLVMKAEVLDSSGSLVALSLSADKIESKNRYAGGCNLYEGK